MDFSNRNRRLKEFIVWFEYKYGLGVNPVKTEGVQRIMDQTVHLQKLLGAHKPVCYWCREVILPALVQVDTDEITIHHIDEDRKHNTVDNLDLCHKTCHQRMHKSSQASGIPTAMLWSAAYGPFKPTGVKLNVEIRGIGRGV